MYPTNEQFGVGASLNGIIKGKPISVVDGAIDGLKSQLNSLIDTLEILESRLSPILGNNLPQIEGGVNIVEPTETRLNIAGDINREARRVQYALKKVNEYIQRLEI